jgi:hypothetical protein
MRKIQGAILVVMLAVAAGRLSADVITVLKPVGGTYKAGTNMDITWTYQFMEWLPATAAQRQMVVTLREYVQQPAGPVPTGAYLDIAAVDVNAGRCAWKVGNVSTNWAGFIITVHMKENQAIHAQSQPFQIEMVQLPKIPVKVAANIAIPVTSPAAGQNCKIGTTVTVRWDKSKIASYGYVWLQVCWPDHTAAGGAFPTTNTGSYDWKIAETAESTLCVKVSTQDDKWIGYSGNFNVKK